MTSTSKAETPNRLIHEGLTLSHLREKGITCGEIHQHHGLGNDFLKLPDLRNVGYSASEMKAGGYNWADIKVAGYTGEDLFEFVKTPEEIQGLAVFKDKGGFKAEDLRCFDIKVLKVAGFTAQDFKAGKIINCFNTNTILKIVSLYFIFSIHIFFVLIYFIQLPYVL